MEEATALAGQGYGLLLRFPISLVTPQTVLNHARGSTTRAKLMAVLESLDNDDIDLWRLQVLRAGLEVCGSSWDFVDNVAVAHAFTELAGAHRVLEVGVRRGFLTAAVASVAPAAELHLVDMWAGDYCNRPNPGPPLVEKQLSLVSYHGEVHFHQGDSRLVLRRLFDTHPGLDFDLIVVDGDHSLAGARSDLETVLPRVAPGGVLIFDDVAHPHFPYLLPVWRKLIGGRGLAFRTAEYLDYGHGVALAIRSYDDGLLRAIPYPPDSRLSRLRRLWSNLRRRGDLHQ